MKRQHPFWENHQKLQKEQDIKFAKLVAQEVVKMLKEESTQRLTNKRRNKDD